MQNIDATVLRLRKESVKKSRAESVLSVDRLREDASRQASNRDGPKRSDITKFA